MARYLADRAPERNSRLQGKAAGSWVPEWGYGAIRMRLEVTTMVLRHPPVAPAARPAQVGWQVCERRIEANAFLALYRVGESVEWDDRLRMAKAALAAHLAAPTTRVFLLETDGVAAGLCAFERCEDAGATLANFGVVPVLRGSGLGRVLLHSGLAAVWRPGRVIRLDTDTNDDPRAQAVYRDAGFAVECVGWKTFPE